MKGGGSLPGGGGRVSAWGKGCLPWVGGFCLGGVCPGGKASAQGVSAQGRGVCLGWCLPMGGVCLEEECLPRGGESV